MNRQLYANGGIMQVAPREKFGLGSKLKKFVRKIIPNEVADIAVKAAPFVAPFNPALAAGMAGIGSFDQTGSIGDSLKRGALTYGGGQAARYIGGAGFQGNPFASGGAFTPSGFTQGFSSPIGADTGLGKFFSNRGTEGVQGISVDSGRAGDSASALSRSTANVPTEALASEVSYVPGGTEALASEVSLVPQAKPDQGFFSSIVEKFQNKDYSGLGREVLDKAKEGGKALFTKPIPGQPGKTQLDKAAVFGAIAFTTSYAEAKALAAETGVDDDLTEAEYDELTKADKKEEYAGYLTNFFGGKKDGGRIGYEQGANEYITRRKKYGGLQDLLGGIDPTIDESDQNIIIVMTEKGPQAMTESEFNEQMGINNETKPVIIDMMSFGNKEKPMIIDLGKDMKKGGRVSRKFGSPKEGESEIGIMSIDVEAGDDEDEEENDLMAGITFSSAEKSYLFRRLGGAGGSDRSYTMPSLYRILNNPNRYPEDARILKEIVTINLPGGQKDGGRIGFAFGSPDRKTDIEEELSVDTIYRPTDKPPMLEEMPGGDKMVGMGNTMKLFETPYGFDRDGFEFMYNEYLDSGKDIPLYDFAIEFLGMVKKDTPKSSITMAAKGGRIGFKDGIGFFDNLKSGFGQIFSGETAAQLGGDQEQINEFNVLKGYGIDLPEDTIKMIVDGYKKGLDISTISSLTETDDKTVGDIITMLNAGIEKKANGGRIGYKGGANRVSELLILRDEKIGKGEDVSDIEAEIFQLTGKTFRSVGGISDIPTGQMRKNNAGVVERDYRDEGGFVPVGIKERADDVPAMLSKNEFVMTADAVRGIGNGSVEEGSKKLYNTMKQAEKVGKA